MYINVHVHVCRLLHVDVHVKLLLCSHRFQNIVLHMEYSMLGILSSLPWS